MIPGKGLDGSALAHRQTIREWLDGECPREKLRPLLGADEVAFTRTSGLGPAKFS